jgi:chromosome segregation ATPase
LNLAGEDKDQLFVDKLKKSIKEVDDEIDMLEGKVRKAKSLEHKAINGIMAAHDNLDELTGVATSRRAGSKTVEGSVKSQLGARETLRQAVAAPNEEVRRRIVERIEPREAIAAGQEEVEEQGKKVQTAMQNLDNSEIVNALTGVERTLTAIQAALEKLPAGQTESAAKSDLANAIEQLQGYRTTVRGGGNLDPQSTNGLLFNINQNLKNLNRRTGKPTGRVPKDINPA